MSLYEDLQKVYKNIPKMESDDCIKKCKSGECKFDCCTGSACSTKEKHLINKTIKKNNMNLPFVTELDHAGMGTYKMPADDKGMCRYITPTGCALYDIRPFICRVMGAVKQMPCTRCPDDAVANYPLGLSVDAGMMPRDIYERNGGEAGIEKFNKILGNIKL